MSEPVFIDTHCHIHEPQYNFNIPETITKAQDAGVKTFIFVGTSVESSRQAVTEAIKYESCFAAIGVHPHEAEDFLRSHKVNELDTLMYDKTAKAVGEVGLDYFYEHSNRKAQEDVLRIQLGLAQKHELPVIFHVRGSRNNPDDVFIDLWRILQDYPKVTRGVMHSFTASMQAFKQVRDNGFLIGINGIMTFSSDVDHDELVRTLPLDTFILETDAPYLTPKPIRGTINEPKNVRLVAEFLAKTRGETLESIASATTKNAQNLFNL